MAVHSSTALMSINISKPDVSVVSSPVSAVSTPTKYFIRQNGTVTELDPNLLNKTDRFARDRIRDRLEDKLNKKLVYTVAIIQEPVGDAESRIQLLDADELEGDFERQIRSINVIIPQITGIAYFTLHSRETPIFEHLVTTHMHSIRRSAVVENFIKTFLNTNRDDLNVDRNESVKARAQALTDLGHLYYEGRGIDKSKQRAFDCYKLAAELGNTQAMCCLGDIYRDNIITSASNHNANESFKWYTKAAEAGNAHAMACLANCYRYNRGVRASDDNLKIAFELFEKSAKLGYPYAMISLGDCYRYNRGVAASEDNLKIAFGWYTKAANLGDHYAMTLLGDCYRENIGVAGSDDRAFDCYKLAAELGNTQAMILLGHYHANKTGVAGSANKAFGWYKRATEAGNTEAMFFLGQCYRKSFGIPADDNSPMEAFKWLKKASDLGNADAMYLLGLYYEENYLKVANSSQNAQEVALNWFEQAAKLGSEHAQKKLLEIRSRLKV